MYYVNLPWYAQIIWLIGVAIILLPILASIAIVVSMVAQRLLGLHKEHVGLELGGNLSTTRLGMTMADGGDPIEAKPDKSKK